MRSFTIAAVLLAGVAAGADEGKKDSSEAAVAAVRAALDKADDAFNRGDAKALVALCDKTFFFAGSTVSARYSGLDDARASIEQMFANGPVGKMTREATTVHVADDGNAAWYIADYTMVPRVSPGMLPVHRKLRESGVLVKRGAQWKLAMVSQSQVQLDPPKAPPPATPAK
jgi:ketosteroid isomerase-like protein